MRAVILFSGGVDSTVCLALAKENGRHCHLLSFNYGQRHIVELEHAKKIAKYYSIPHEIITIDLSFLRNSSLINCSLEIPKNRNLTQMNASIPNTYVPARNIIFLSYSLSFAEFHSAEEIYLGANSMDRPYPDCRPEFIQSFQNMISLGTKGGTEGHPPQIITPLLELNKSDIISLGKRLKAPLEMTFSCYDPSPEGFPCKKCDSCTLRQLII